MYCPQCGSKLDNSKYCPSCSENLDALHKYISYKSAIKLFFTVFFFIFIGFLIYGSDSITSTTANNYIYLASLLFIFIIVYPIFYQWVVIPVIRRSQSQRYCPKCEHEDFNENFCVECGYNLKNVLGCFKCNLGVDLYDIEFNKNYINIYRHIIERGDSGGEYHERLAPNTLYSIRNLELSPCKTLIFHRLCLKFEHGGRVYNFKLKNRDEDKVNAILSSCPYDTNSSEL